MKKLPLKKPLTFGSKTIDALNFRQHTTAADYLAFDRKGGVAQRIALIASLTGTDEALIEQLHGVDYRRAEAEADRLMSEDEAEFSDGGNDDHTLTPEQEASLKK